MPEWLIQVVLVLGPVLLGGLMTWFHFLRSAFWKRIFSKLDHLDECMDEVKVEIAKRANHESRINRLEEHLFLGEARGD